MRSAVALLIICAFVPAAAAAVESPRLMVLESYADARPLGMSHYVAEIIDDLGMPGITSGDDLRTKLEAHFSRPAGKATAEDLQALVERARDGVNAFGAANFNIAVTQLSQVVDGLAREPAALIADSKLRETRKEALLTLAKALAKLHREGEARAAVAEAVRSYPELEFSEAVYPPNIVQLAKTVQKERATHPHSFQIVTSPPGKRVFLDEVPVGLTPVTKTGLLAGTYRVFFPSMGASGHGAYRIVEVDDKSSSLAVSSDIEDHLELAEYVGLRFSSVAQQQKAEVPIACAIAEALALDKPTDEIIILTRQRSPAAEAELMGAIYDVKGHRKWASIIPLSPNPPDDTMLARFAKSLRLRREVEGVKAAPPEAPRAPAVAAAPTPQLQLVAPPANSTDDFRYNFGDAAPDRSGHKYFAGWYGVSAAVALAGTVGWLASRGAYHCSDWLGTDLSGPCGPDTAGRSMTVGFFGVALIGWSGVVATGIVNLMDYGIQRDLWKKGYRLRWSGHQSVWYKGP